MYSTYLGGWLDRWMDGWMDVLFWPWPGLDPSKKIQTARNMSWSPTQGLSGITQLHSQAWQKRAWVLGGDAAYWTTDVADLSFSKTPQLCGTDTCFVRSLAFLAEGLSGRTLQLGAVLYTAALLGTLLHGQRKAGCGQIWVYGKRQESKRVP